ncbi:hypothetical protein ACIRG5_28410 [Lentzea sp. NPDC102401]|uniref:hypothetical protein n=1 Tax=Lentzea sp. NPDC102401 TaxID=3364128 RepID=UPI00382A7828
MTGLPPLEERRPQFRASKFTCPHCQMYTPHEWSTLRRIKASRTSRESVPLEGDNTRMAVASYAEAWWTSVCASCEQPSVWRHERMLYPLRLGGAAHEDMPTEVRELFEEATAVAAVSRRAGAAMARTTLERLIKVLDPSAPSGATLAVLNDRLRPRISATLGQRLDIVRVAGNGAVHVDQAPGDLVVLALDDASGPQLLELMLATANDLVDELISRPKLTSTLWDKTPAGRASTSPAS